MITTMSLWIWVSIGYVHWQWTYEKDDEMLACKPKGNIYCVISSDYFKLKHCRILDHELRLSEISAMSVHDADMMKASVDSSVQLGKRVYVVFE